MVLYMQLRDRYNDMHNFPSPLSEAFLSSMHEWVKTEEEDEAGKAMEAAYLAEKQEELEVC
jgi:hypothetical protein